MSNLPVTPNGILSVSYTFAILSAGFVALRFYTRRVNKVPLKGDDWCLLVALTLVEALVIFSIVAVGVKCFGYGAKAPTSTKGNTVLFAKMFFAFQKLQTLSLGFIKATAILFYRRVFYVGRKLDIFNITTMVLFVIIMLWTATFFILDLFACGTHIDAAWTGVASYLKYCHIATAFEEALAISDFILDVIILLVPLPKIWGLQATIKRRLAISVAFGFGIVGTVASGIRMSNFIHLVNKDRKNQKTGDIRLIDTEAAYWSILESGLTIIAVALPSTWGLISKMTPESMVRSLRSVISLGSIHSTKPATKSDTTQQAESTAKTSGVSQSSQTEILGNDSEGQDYKIHTVREDKV